MKTKYFFIIILIFLQQITFAQWYSLNVPTTGDLLDLWFNDANTGYVIGNFGKIFKTTDGGENWSEKNSGTNNVLRSIYFTSHNTGYVCGEAGTVLKTTDGGDNWTDIFPGITNFSSIYFVDENLGYLAGSYLELPPGNEYG
ncbi:MAG: hypothetical protein EHM47_03510, partial [Ignavibacteriales bacterium]